MTDKDVDGGLKKLSIARGFFSGVASWSHKSVSAVRTKLWEIMM